MERGKEKTRRDNDHDGSKEEDGGKDENGRAGEASRQSSARLMHSKHSKYWYRLLLPFPSHLCFLLTLLRINRKWSRMDSRDSDKRLDFMLAALAA